MTPLKHHFQQTTTLRIAANSADIATDTKGDEFLRNVLDTFTERLDNAADADATWTAVAIDENDNIDGEWLTDIVWSVADDATSRLIYHGDIVDAYAGIHGWREEGDVADNGLFAEDNSIEQRCLIVLATVAERFVWSLIAVLRNIQEDLDAEEAAQELAAEVEADV